VAEAHVDQDMIGEPIRWYRSELDGEALRKPVGPCPHTDCRHWGQSVVAWGGDFEHYELVVCDDAPGCAGGWSSEIEPRGVHVWLMTARAELEGQ
jgi:hypothetical protein